MVRIVLSCSWTFCHTRGANLYEEALVRRRRGAAATACGSAQAEVINARAILGGGEEVPALLTGAVAVADLVIDTNARTIAVEIRIFNIPSATTAGHIHVGPKGVAGPVVVDFPIPQNRVGDMNLNFTVGASQLRPIPESGSTPWTTSSRRSSAGAHT